MCARVVRDSSIDCHLSMQILLKHVVVVVLLFTWMNVLWL